MTGVLFKASQMVPILAYICNLTYFGQITKRNILSNHVYAELAIDPFHVRENVSKLEDKTKEI